MPHITRVLPKQAEFLTFTGQMMAIRGGIRSGKSWAIANWMHDRMELYPDGGHYAIGSDLPQLKRGFLLTFMDLLDQYGIGYDYYSTTGTVILKHNGAQLKCLSAEMKQRIRSTEMDSVLLEEPQTWQNGLEVYRVVVGRMSGSPKGKKYFAQGMQPQLRMSFNPSSIGSWLWDLIERQHAMPCLQFSVYDNYLMPNYREYIALQRSQLPPALWPVELGGEWGTAGGQVYRFYNAIQHANPIDGLPPLAFDPAQPLGWSLDFNVGLMCSTIFQLHHQNMAIVGYKDPPYGTLGLAVRKPIVAPAVKGAQRTLFYILGEMRIPDCSVYQLVPRFIKKYGDWARVAGVHLYGDSTGGNRGQQTLETNWEIVQKLLGEANIPYKFCVEKNPFEGDRVNAHNAQFWTGDGIGLFADHARCPFLIADWQTVTYKEGTNDIDKDRDESITHLSDAMGYPIASIRRANSNDSSEEVAETHAGYLGR